MVGKTSREEDGGNDDQASLKDDNNIVTNKNTHFDRGSEGNSELDRLLNYGKRLNINIKPLPWHIRTNCHQNLLKRGAVELVKRPIAKAGTYSFDEHSESAKSKMSVGKMLTHNKTRVSRPRLQ